MKRAIAFILCLLLLTGCVSPPTDDTVTKPTPAGNPTETTEPASVPEEVKAPADPIIRETQPPAEIPDPLPQPLYLAEKCRDLLDMDYPVFLLAGIAIIENEYIEKYSPAENASDEDITRYERELLEIPYLHTYSMDLNVSKTGELLFTYSAPSPDGNSDTTAVLNLEDTGWEQTPTTEEAYSRLLDHAAVADGAYAAACEWLLSALLQDDPASFSAALSLRPETEITNAAFLISMDFFYSDSLDKLEQIANALSAENVKTALLNAVAERRA